MKLIIQIPCLNEEASLPVSLGALPRRVAGFEVVEWLVIDDGSTDGTVEVALAHGVDHIVRLPRNKGLATAFMAGLERCIAEGADVIVNTDADNQYYAEDIPRLVAPILAGKAEIVVGARPIAEIQHFSPVKKALQFLGSWVVRLASRTTVPDAPSGFRAFTRDAAMKLNVFNEYTYTLETLIQAGQKGLAVTSVPIRVNGDLRPSRLVRSIPSYVWISLTVISRIFMTYRPFRFFFVPGVFTAAAGVALGCRFVYFYLTDGGAGRIQSLMLAALLMGMGGFLMVTGLVADLVSVNRQLLERLNWRLHRVEGDLRGRRGDGRDRFEEAG